MRNVSSARWLDQARTTIEAVLSDGTVVTAKTSNRGWPRKMIQDWIGAGNSITPYSSSNDEADRVFDAELARSKLFRALVDGIADLHGLTLAQAVNGLKQRYRNL